MRHLPILFPLVIVVAFAFASCGPNVPPTIPMEDFFKNPQLAYFQLSPDGKHISFTKPFERRMNVYVTAIGSKDTMRATSLTDRDIFQYFWKGNERILYFRDLGGDENDHLFSVRLDGTDEKELTPFPGVKVILVDEMKDHDTDVLIGTNRRNAQVFDVYRVNTQTGEMTMVAENPGNVTGWITDHEYRVRIAVVTDGVNSVYHYRDGATGPFREVLKTSFRETLEPTFFTFDNKDVYAISNLNRDRIAVVRYDMANAKELEVLYEHPEVDVSSLSYSRKRKVLTEIGFVTWKHERKVLDPEAASMYKRFEAEFPGYEVHTTFTTRAEDRFIVRTINDRSAGSYYLYDKATGAVTLLAVRNPWLDPEHLSEMKPVTYTTRDGLTIHGYLTLPKGRGTKNLPVVVNPHGGPWTRDAWIFNVEAQFLANRGYAVFQMNFRGSTGYGRKFWESSFKEWGKKMQDDITDGVKWLIDQGTADPKRIAIYGASYGGYATLAGLTFTPDLYACGIDYVGVSNLFTWMGGIPPYWEPFREMLYEMVGDPVTDSTLIAEASPFFFADRIKVPLLIAQGANDPKVPKAESDKMVEALRKRGIEVEYLVKENEGHGFANEENVFDLYRAMEGFLGKHLAEK